MWKYRNKELKIAPDSDKYIGFIYEMTYKPTGQKYIGRKRFWLFKKTRIGKKEKALTKTRKTFKYVPKETDWKNYFSSNQFLMDNATKKNTDRKILRMCKSKTEMTYYECKYQFCNGVLESDKWLNGNILGKIFKTE
jgi:hypothetical protein